MIKPSHIKAFEFARVLGECCRLLNRSLFCTKRDFLGEQTLTQTWLLMPQLDHVLSSWREIHGKHIFSMRWRVCSRTITAQQ